MMKHRARAIHMIFPKVEDLYCAQHALDVKAAASSSKAETEASVTASCQHRQKYDTKVARNIYQLLCMSCDFCASRSGLFCIRLQQREGVGEVLLPFGSLAWTPLHSEAFRLQKCKCLGFFTQACRTYLVRSVRASLCFNTTPRQDLQSPNPKNATLQRAEHKRRGVATAGGGS